MTTRRQFLNIAAATLASPALPSLARAQTWPSKTIRAVVPFNPGSSIDVIGRIVLDPLSARLGVPIVVENHGGAAGTIGSAEVAKAEPDGYTLLVHASAYTLAPAIYAHLPYDAVTDFSGVAMFGSIPNVLIVSPAKKLHTLQEFVAAAKAGSFTYGSAGVGSATHWAAERLRASAGFKGVHVPFKGGLDAITEIMAGRVDFACMGLSSAFPFIQSGQLVALAVSTPKRSKALPNVPTTLEAGYANSDYTFWNGMLVSSKTPREIVQRLYRETTAVLQMPAVQQKFAPQGIEPMPLTPPEFDQLIKKEIAQNKELVTQIGLTPVGG
jgi:tripartite-type tricarboxylate transporter receptor subunit TctC